MSYFAVCTFDLKDADYKDYENACSDLAAIGFDTQLTAHNGDVIALPTTTTAGEFNGNDAGSVRDALRTAVKRAFAARGFTSEIFISVGGNWGWCYTTT